MKANNNGWTDERRAKQARLIRNWKPWEKSTGAKTPEGKDIAKMNARRITIQGLYRRCCKLCYYRKQWEKHGGYLPPELEAQWTEFRIENDDWMDNARQHRPKARTQN